jgi:molybdopterin-guanine dinucleotide biosynthesis protein A
MPAEVTAGVILAGGRSRRMGGKPKALMPLAGKPLIQHVIDRVRPQVGQLVLSVEQTCSDFEAFGLEQVPDPRPGSRGPLGGLLAALRRMEAGYDWMMVAPCDAPFLPNRLAERLLECAGAAALPGAVVRDSEGIQPAFSLWHRSLLPSLERAVLESEMAGFKQFLRVQPLAELDWPSFDISPFFNINDHEALDEAARLVD